MKCKSASFLRMSLTVIALAAVSFAQSPQTLPGCEPVPEVRKALDEQLNWKNLDKMKFSDRVAREHAVYEELIAKYPREVEPYRRLIMSNRNLDQRQLDPSQYPALQERFRKQAAHNPDDPLALYAAGYALFGTDTPESLRLLEAAKAKAPQFAWPILALAEEYSDGTRMDKQKSFENVAAFFALCPNWTGGTANRLLSVDEDSGLKQRVAKARRARLAKETDPARLEDYGTLWSIEFRANPPQEYDALRKQIAEDLKRIEPLNPKPDSEWLAFLISGYKQAGASPEAITSMEDRLLRDYPHSNEAYDIVSARWKKANKKPEDQKDVAAWAKYHEAYKEALKGWIRDFPDNSYLAHNAWFYAISDEDSLTEKDGIAIVDERLRYNAMYSQPGAAIDSVADFLLKHKWQPSRALDLLVQAKTFSDSYSVLLLAGDDFSTEDRDDLNESMFSWHEQMAANILKAVQLAGRPDAAKAVKEFVEGPPPTQDKFLSDYWWNRARLAAIENRKLDALAYYQLSLHTRLEPPQYWEGKFRDDLTDEAQALWKETGGTPAAWAVWSKPLNSKEAELAQGRWEKPKKTLPAFELSDLSGKTWRLKELAGKAVLINEWATWCGPCNEELPKLQKLYEQVKDRSDIQILTFNIDENPGLVASFLKEKGYTFPILSASSLVNNMQVNGGIPQNWVVDTKGNWLWTQIGYGAEDNWAQVMIQKLESAKTGN
jgi:thiol-disulfide isomerase/thioredoxin